MWYHLAQEAEEALHQGQCRLSADKFLMSFRAIPDKWEFKRYHVLRGYTHAFEEQSIVASHEDIEALKKIASDSKELKLYRCQAACTYGYVYWLRGDLEESHDCYREVLRIASKAKRKERRYKVLAPVMSPDGSRSVGVGATMMGNVLDRLCGTASRILEQWKPTTDKSLFREGTVVFTTSFPSNVGLERATYLLSVGGDQCDCCQRTAKEVGLKGLDRCARCAKAWYCGKACQLKQWKAGHSECCRKPGKVKAGDYVAVKGLEAENDNTTIVQVLGPDPECKGNWEVQIGGGDMTIKGSVPVANMRQLRPLK
ncbi:MAG: hypothetical protein SGILL_003421 [Bacillariaceae sp.]